MNRESFVELIAILGKAALVFLWVALIAFAVNYAVEVSYSDPDPTHSAKDGWR